MHAVKLSWVGQPVALARCSDAREKKPRSRKSKEERRAMVKSFIKKYQNSNNGNFPSLNMTHKEVGGSFYTVREIVREIIQENKVLRPGSPTSKVLNLVNCSDPEDQETASFYMDPASHLSMSAIGHPIDKRQKEVDFLSKDHQKQSEEHFDSHPSGISSQLMQGKSSHCLERSFLDETLSNGYFVDIEYDEADLRKPSGQTHDNSTFDGQIYPEVEGHSLVGCEAHQVEQPTSLYQPISIISGSYELVKNDDDIQNKSNNAVGARNSSAECNVDSKVIEADKIPESKILNSTSASIFPNQSQDCSDSYANKVFPLASMSGSTCDTEKKFLQSEGPTSVEVQGAHTHAREVQVDSALIDEVSIKNRIGTTESLSCSVDEETATIPTILISGISVSPAPKTRNEPQDVSHPKNLKNMRTNIGSPFGESHSPDGNKITEPAVKAEHDSLCDATVDDNSTRHFDWSKRHYIIRNSRHSGPKMHFELLSMLPQKADKESGLPESNPLWAAVKAFVTAFIRFWTE